MASIRLVSLYASLLLGVTLAGCTSPPPPPPGPPTYRGVALRLGVLGDVPALRSARALANDWAAVHECEVAAGDGAGGADVLIFPAAKLGDLVDSGTLRALPESLFRRKVAEGEVTTPAEGESAAPEGEEAWSPDAFPEVLAARAGRYGEDLMALPYATSALVLAYRRDAFEKPELQQAAQEAGVKLGPPATWEELDALARFLNEKDWAGNGRPGAGLAVPLAEDARERLGEAIFIARAASLGQHPDQYSFLFDYDSMEPRLGLPFFAETLGGIAAWKGDGPEGCGSFDAEAARAAFRDGKAAMLIDRAEMAARWSDPANPHAVAVAQLPGSARVYNTLIKEYEPADPANPAIVLPGIGGWMVGISSKLEGKQVEAAVELAKVLAGKDAAPLVARDPEHPALSAHTSALNRPAAIPGLDARSWSRAVLKTLGSGRARPALRLPGIDAYDADLDRAVARAAAGEVPGTILDEVARGWRERIAAGGKDRLRWHYCRGLNDVQVDAEPPAKR